MSRYYFDLLDDDMVAPDEEGLELSDLRKVQAEAAKSLADMARDAVETYPAGRCHQMAIEVRDETGPVMRVRFSFEVQRLKRQGRLAGGLVAFGLTWTAVASRPAFGCSRLS
ncbi:DUF6894 family protein [Bradyrhizobium sp. 18BD]